MTVRPKEIHWVRLMAQRTGIQMALVMATKTVQMMEKS